MQAGELVAGRYRLEREVGSGGMGTVWQAFDEDARLTVAIKRAAQETAAGGERARRGLRREARIAARVVHPHVVAFLGEAFEGPERFLVLEYVPSQSLGSILEEGPLGPELVVHLGAQIAGGLAAVHAHGIVHRDIKPGNVLVTEDGTAKLTDFGISRALCGDVTVTDTGVIGGTVAFLAPEVANGEEPTVASDVFGLGATLFTAVEGSPPVGTGSPQLLLRRAGAGDFRPCRRAGLLAPALSALLEIDPARRPDAAAAAQLLHELAGESAQPWPVGGPGRKRRLRRRITLIGTGSVAVLAVGLALAALGPEEAPAKAIPAPTLGDARTADPCALTDPHVLGQFGNGTTDYESALGNFNRCDVIVTMRGGTQVQVMVELEKPGPPKGTMESRGALRIFRQPQDRGECVRTVLLADQYRIKVTAKPYEHQPGSADLCPIANAATDHVLTVLDHGAIPRRPRPPDAASLANADACKLLDPTALTRVLGPDAGAADPGFERWECRWRGTTSNLSVRLAFDRNKSLDGRRMELNAHEVYIKPEPDEPDCLAQVVYRPDQDENTKRVNEHLRIVVKGPRTPDQLCEPATALAAAAAANLAH